MNRRTRTPHLAILAGGVVGIAAIFSDSLITISGMPLTGVHRHHVGIWRYCYVYRLHAGAV
ncbi:Uncharacterised protein [Atlantibacter hermannii]|nr:Uncharacterised protein [Atlantibacter hermannii]